MSNPKVSVIIPVYNSEKYLAECLKSVINQTLKEIEILCVNDGSTDGSAEILEQYAKKDERIKIFNQENKGAGSARNVGLKEAKGEFLAFLDSDDFYNVDYIEKMYNKAKNTNSDIVICAARSFDVITQEYASMPWSLETKLLPKKEIFNYKDIPDYIFNIAQNWNWNKLYKREFVEKNNIVFQEIYRTNDLLFTCKALVLAEKISVINEELVNYRISQETNCQSTNETHPFDFYCAFKELRKFLISKKIYKQVKKSYLAWAIDGCVYNIKSVKDVEIAKKIEKKVFQKGLKELGLKNYKIIKKEASYDFEAFEKMIKMRRKNFWQNIFSLRNSEDKKYKILTFFGVKFNFGRV